MAGPQSYSRESPARHVRCVGAHAKNRDQLLKNGTGEQVRQAERSISKVRSLAEEEFNALESLITKARNSSGDPSMSS